LNGWLLDTNVVIELTRPQATRRVLAWAMGVLQAQVFVSVLTLGEFDKGLHNLQADSPIRPRVIGDIAALEQRFARRVLGVSDAIVRRWGALSGQVKRATRQSPPVIDTLLAATALEHDLYLVTRNVRDVAGTGVAVFNPWDDDPALFPLKSRRM
jgi:predicted nucleic acid-binding protein